ncbi:hypothetical protein JW898_01250 [Candidatus Woesearchaeota archaeon]|nr:hypothetical protein [Candidatus Woesearchaeota archaeon]
MDKEVSGKKMLMVLFFIAFAISFHAYSVSAEKHLLVYVDAGDGFAGLGGFSVIEFNDYTYLCAVEGDYQEVDGLEVRLSDVSGNVLATAQVHQGDNLLDYLEGVSGIALMRSGSELFSSATSFCNNNKVCEPCLGGFCSLAENFVSCSDCFSGSNDGFCDTVQDGICDPDCNYDVADPDCESVCSQDCGVGDASKLPVCADFRGISCGPNEDCIGGSMLYTTDSMYCCVGGFCAEPAEYVTSRVTALNHPEGAFTPLGERASDVLARIGDYCLDDLKGSICEPHEDCDGEWVEFYYDTFCCVGSCMPIPEELYSEDYIEELYYETSVPIPEEEVARLYPSEYSPDREIEEAADYFAVEESEVNRVIEEEAALEEARRGVVIDAIMKVVPPVPEKLKGFNFTIVVGALLVLVLIVVVFVALFRRSADRMISQSEKDAAAASAVPAKSVADVQGTIDALVSKGYDYKQVRSFLLQRGYSLEVANAEIMKNYDARKASLVRQK